MSEQVSLVPIVGNFTADLLDEFDPDFVKWMLADLESSGKGPEGEAARAVKDAIASSVRFKNTVNAALQAVLETNKHYGKERGPGEVSLVMLLLICGWKLCELRMMKMAESSAVT
jgi:hypothetical protein